MKTIVIDIFQGDPVPPDALSSPTSDFDFVAWLAKHGPEQVRPPIDEVVDALKKEGVTIFAATGYCFGARYVFNLAFDNVIQVAAISHPSFLKVPDDLEVCLLFIPSEFMPINLPKKYLTTSNAPLLINSCTIDSRFPHESQAKADEILGDGKFKPGYKREYFEGCTHGFAVRGDLSDPKVKAGKEGAFKATVEWFLKHL